MNSFERRAKTSKASTLLVASIFLASCTQASNTSLDALFGQPELARPSVAQGIFDQFEDPESLLLVEDTQLVGSKSHDATYSYTPSSDVDPSTFQKRNRTKEDSEVVITRPEDPAFTHRTGGKRDRSLVTKVPVWGIVTEPIQAQLDQGQWTEYIPSSHVKYLEQTGAKAIPISYQTTDEELTSLLSQVSGVYFTGDSSLASQNKRYMKTLATILEFAMTVNIEKSDYFPVIFQNNAFASFLNLIVPNDKSIMAILPGHLVNANAKLRTTIDPVKSFIFDELTQEELDEYVHDGSVYNRQPLGVTVKHFENEPILYKRYHVVATFNEAPQLSPSLSSQVEPTDDREYVAILESLDIPLYAFSYDLSYTQYVYSDRIFAEGGKQLIDHSIFSRNHVQYLASQIHDEGGHCKHNFTQNYKAVQQLGELADIEYSSLIGKDAQSAPAGLESQEVYLFQYD